ncbi:uncharacterized protein G2W53_000849 [Senna tora]|uniref:Uncharacterized protein n=1 Tax=Senna tora TaxID=362788 RepID=A0A835CIW5_9FABA|nr:uncharacterized protein G2W53_000849 [Senna tora]
MYGIPRERVTIDPCLTEIPETRPLHEINFSSFESSYSTEETVSLDSRSTADFFRVVQNTPPLLTSSEEEDFEPQSEIDLTLNTLSCTQGSSKASFNFACSWTVISDISEDDNT